MSTDPYSNIDLNSPTLNQTNYIEVISVSEKEELAIITKKSNVSDSLNQLAYKSGNRNLPSDPSVPNEIIHVEGSLPPARTYNLSLFGHSNGQSNRVERTYNEYMNLTSNIYPRAIPCSLDQLTLCEGDSGCAVDLVVVRDNFWRIGFYDDIIKVYDQITTLTSNCRIGAAQLFDYWVKDDPRNSDKQYLIDQYGIIRMECNNVDFASDNNIFRRGYSWGNDYLSNVKKVLGEILSGERCGQFRAEAEKILLFLTYEYTTQTVTYGYNKEEYDAFFLDLATSAANCGIKIIWGNIERSESNPAFINQRANGQMVAAMTGGLYIEQVLETTQPYPNYYVRTSKLSTYTKNYISQLCAAPPEEECVTNLVLNGDFNIGLQGWLNNNSAAVTLSNGAVKISTAEYAGITGVTPIPSLSQQLILDDLKIGDIVTLYFDLRPEISGEALPGSLAISFFDAVGDDQIYTWNSSFNGERISYSKEITSEMISDDNYKLLRFMVNSPNYPETNGLFACYIDNVVVCKKQNSLTCRNLIKNSTFENGVESWYRLSSYSPCYEQVPSSYWDAADKALLLSGSNNEAFVTIDEYFYKVTFDILSADGSNINLSTKWGSCGSGSYVGSGAVYNLVDTSKINEFPYTVVWQFPVEKSSERGFGSSYRSLHFEVAGLFGSAKITNVIACGIPQCEETYTSFATSQAEIRNLLNTSLPQSSNVSVFNGSINIREGGSLVRDYNMPSGTLVKLKLSLAYNSPVFFDTVQPRVMSDCPLKVELISDGYIDSIIIDPADTGDKILNSVVRSSGTIRMVLTAVQSTNLATNPLAMIAYFNLCVKEPPCNAKIQNLTAKIKWDGIPRKPVNIFNAFARIILRDSNDVYSKTIINAIPFSDGRSSYTGCNQWTRNDKTTVRTIPLLAEGLNDNKLLQINSGNFESVAYRRDFYWAIPYSEVSNASDELIISFGSTEYGPIVESVEIFYLINIANPSGVDTIPEKMGPFACLPDPAQEYEVILEYEGKNGRNTFSGIAHKNNLYPQDVDFNSIAPNKWDSLSPTANNGLRGSAARWQSVKFDLDLATGGGLDQCSPAIGYNTKGKGDLKLNSLEAITNGKFIDPCDAEVLIEEITTGAVENAQYSLALPGAMGGNWTITVIVNGRSRTITVAYNINADTLKNRLEQIDTIEVGNVTVEGQGKSTSPFIIRFINELAGLPIELTADGTNLTGSGTAIVNTITTGTPNERQVIKPVQSVMSDLIVQFNGATSLPIRYNASINEKKAAIEAISTIGFGNITVTGWTDDPTIPYTGDIIIDFTQQYPLALGPLSDTNVPELVVSPSEQYSVATLWEGGTGVNEVQQIRIIAKSGTYRLTVYDPNDLTLNTTFQTIPLPYNATASQVKAAIIDADFLTTNEVSVIELPEETVSEGLEFYGFEIEFKGSKAKVNVNQTKVDTTSLVGGTIKVVNDAVGGATYEKQRLTILRANSGYYRLLINVNGTEEWTDKITYDSTEEGLQADILTHSLLNAGDVTVTQINNGPNPDVKFRYDITFKKYGDIPLMEVDYQSSLLCYPPSFKPAPPPPYSYPLSLECETEVSCQSGPMLVKPCPGDSPLPTVKCDITESANVSRSMLYNRDLVVYGSSIKTVKDLAVVKNLKTKDFVPYIRDQDNRVLIGTSYSQSLSKGMSVIFISKSIDSRGSRDRVLKHLYNGANIKNKQVAIAKVLERQRTLFGISFKDTIINYKTDIGNIDILARDNDDNVYAIMILTREVNSDDVKLLSKLTGLYIGKPFSDLPELSSSDYGIVLGHGITREATILLNDSKLRFGRLVLNKENILPSRVILK